MPPNSSDRTPLLGEVDESHTQRGTLSRARARLSQIEHASSLSIRDIVLMLACLALVILGLCILIKYDDRRILQEICITRDCVKTASRLLSALDESVDPCDDFYAFATGGWQKSHTIPTNKSEVSVFDDVSLEVERVVHDLATRPIDPKLPSGDQDNLAKLHTWYTACLDVDAQNTQGAQPLVAVVHELMRLPTHTSQLAWMHAHALDTWFQVSISGDPGSAPRSATPFFASASLGLPDKSYYANNKTAKKYTELVDAGLQRLVDAGISSLRGVQASHVVELETALANAAPSAAESNDPIATYHPMAPEELALQVPSIDWPTYWATLSPVHPSRVILASPSYMRAVDALLSSTSEHVRLAYAAWTLVRTMGLSLGPHVPLRQPAERLYHMVHGVASKVREKREPLCAASASASLGHLVGRYYVQEALPTPSVPQVARIAEAIRSAFLRRLFDLPWLDAKTKRAAVAKASAISFRIAQPQTPDLLQASDIAAWYSDLNVTHSLFDNEWRAQAWRVHKAYSYVGGELNRGALGNLVPTDVKAEYVPAFNEMDLAAGILQPPFFDANWPMYLKFGAIGSIAGHELSHAFDPHGRLYNSQGLLSDWWTNATAHAFVEQQKCIERQYAEYWVDDGHGHREYVDSRFTVGEDVADAAGIAQSFRAWKHILDNGGIRIFEQNQLLPGLAHYTQEQLFFVAFAHLWASLVRPAEQVRRIRTDPHSPARFRVNGALSNMPSFAEAFGCKPRHHPMVRSGRNRCDIW